jgi:hypothetical protein
LLTIAELRSISASRIDEAQALLDAGHYDGVVYLCGYAVELALKAQVCETLNWVGYPYTNREFRELQSFRTHNLRLLLRLSGQDSRIKGAAPDVWSNVSRWNPELRYLVPGSTSESSASDLLSQVKLIVGVL